MGRAYELPAAEIKALARALYRRFVDTPRDFFPPRIDPETGDSDVHPTHH